MNEKRHVEPEIKDVIILMLKTLEEDKSLATDKRCFITLFIYGTFGNNKFKFSIKSSISMVGIIVTVENIIMISGILEIIKKKAAHPANIGRSFDK